MDFYENVKKLVKSNNFSLRTFIEDLGINYDTYNGQKRLNNIPINLLSFQLVYIFDLGDPILL